MSDETTTEYEVSSGGASRVIGYDKMIDVLVDYVRVLHGDAKCALHVIKIINRLHTEKLVINYRGSTVTLSEVAA